VEIVGSKPTAKNDEIDEVQGFLLLCPQYGGTDGCNGNSKWICVKDSVFGNKSCHEVYADILYLQNYPCCLQTTQLGRIHPEPIR